MIGQIEAHPGSSQPDGAENFVNDADGNPIYENTMQYAILKKERDARTKNPSK